MKHIKLILFIALMLFGQAFADSFSGNLTAAGHTLGPIYVRPYETITYSLSGFGSATVQLQKSDAASPWETIQAFTANQSSAVYANRTNKAVFIRWNVLNYSSGTIAATLADVDGDIVKDEIFNPYTNQVVLQINDQGEIVAPNGFQGSLDNTSPLTIESGAAGTSSIFHDAATGIMQICGGTSAATGPCLNLYGASHASAANDVLLETSGGSDLVLYDHSAVTAYYGYGTSFVHEFQGNEIALSTGATDIGLINMANNDGGIQITGGTNASNSSRMIMYGGSHATLAEDIVIEDAAGNDIIFHDESAGDLFLGGATNDLIVLQEAAVTIGNGAGQPLLTLSNGSGSGAAILTGQNNGNLQIFASNDQTGLYWRIYSPSHATLARDYQVNNGSSNVVYYDYSANLITYGYSGASHTFVGGSIHTPVDVELTADDQAVTTVGSRVIELSSDNATAANRTFTLSAGTEGQLLTLYWNDADEGQLADTGTTLLTANWEPTNIGQSLQLYYNGTNWVELTRAAP